MLPASPPVTVILFKCVFLFSDLENTEGKQGRGSRGCGKVGKKWPNQLREKKNFDQQNSH